MIERKKYNVVPGLNYISHPSLAYCKLLFIEREKAVHHDITINSPSDPVNFECLHDRSSGVLFFDSNKPFISGETVSVIKKNL